MVLNKHKNLIQVMTGPWYISYDHSTGEIWEPAYDVSEQTPLQFTDFSDHEAVPLRRRSWSFQKRKPKEKKFEYSPENMRKEVISLSGKWKAIVFNDYSASNQSVGVPYPTISFYERIDKDGKDPWIGRQSYRFDYATVVVRCASFSPDTFTFMIADGESFLVTLNNKRRLTWNCYRRLSYCSLIFEDKIENLFGDYTISRFTPGASRPRPPALKVPDSKAKEGKQFEPLDGKESKAPTKDVVVETASTFTMPPATLAPRTNTLIPRQDSKVSVDTEETVADSKKLPTSSTFPKEDALILGKEVKTEREGKGLCSSDEAKGSVDEKGIKPDFKGPPTSPSPSETMAGMPLEQKKVEVTSVLAKSDPLRDILQANYQKLAHRASMPLRGYPNYGHAEIAFDKHGDIVVGRARPTEHKKPGHASFWKMDNKNSFEGSDFETRSVDVYYDWRYDAKIWACPTNGDYHSFIPNDGATIFCTASDIFPDEAKASVDSKQSEADKKSVDITKTGRPFQNIRGFIDAVSEKTGFQMLQLHTGSIRLYRDIITSQPKLVDFYSLSYSALSMCINEEHVAILTNSRKNKNKWQIFLRPLSGIKNTRLGSALDPGMIVGVGIDGVDLIDLGVRSKRKGDPDMATHSPGMFLSADSKHVALVSYLRGKCGTPWDLARRSSMMNGTLAQQAYDHYIDDLVVHVFDAGVEGKWQRRARHVHQITAGDLLPLSAAFNSKGDFVYTSSYTPNVHLIARNEEKAIQIMSKKGFLASPNSSTTDVAISRDGTEVAILVNSHILADAVGRVVVYKVDELLKAARLSA